jgi:hypothetical protein
MISVSVPAFPLSATACADDALKVFRLQEAYEMVRNR